MARKYKCEKCGYVWESEVKRTTRHCLRCYSKEIRPFRPVRDKISYTSRKLSKIQESTSKGFTSKFPAFRDTLTDFWQTVKGFVFIALVFILFVIFALIYIYYM